MHLNRYHSILVLLLAPLVAPVALIFANEIGDPDLWGFGSISETYPAWIFVLVPLCYLFCWANIALWSIGRIASMDAIFKPFGEVAATFMISAILGSVLNSQGGNVSVINNVLFFGVLGVALTLPVLVLRLLFQRSSSLGKA
jgi:hypothetical protein